MLGTSDPWSMSHLSLQTSEAAYHIVDCRIFGPAFANLITWKYCLEVTYIYIRSKAVVSIAVFAYNAWIKAICSCGSAQCSISQRPFEGQS